jgi:hypothetical protein
VVGLVSDGTGDLRIAMLSVLFVLPVTLGLLIYAARTLPAREAGAVSVLTLPASRSVVVPLVDHAARDPAPLLPLGSVR